MKRYLILFLLAVISIGAYAQTEKGRSSVGVHIGCGFDDIDNASIGVDYRYCITDQVRITPSLSYFVRNHHVSAASLDFNAHYVVKLSEMFGFYPLAGVNLSFWDFQSVSATRLGANIGLGGEVYATQNLSVGLEMKYMAIKDLSRPLVAVRVGYSF